MFAKFLMAAALLLAGNVYAHEYAQGPLKIIHPWARATPPGAATGGGFLQIENTGAADRLISAEAGVSAAVELHTMTMEGNVMRMSRLENGIELPAGKTVTLQPGGLHVMFIGLKAPLKEGDKFPLKLKFEKAGEVMVDVLVQGMGAGAAAEAPMQHQH